MGQDMVKKALEPLCLFQVCHSSLTSIFMFTNLDALLPSSWAFRVSILLGEHNLHSPTLQCFPKVTLINKAKDNIYSFLRVQLFIEHATKNLVKKYQNPYHHTNIIHHSNTIQYYTVQYYTIYYTI